MQNKNQKRNRYLNTICKWLMAIALIAAIALSACTQDDREKIMGHQKEQTSTHGVGRFIIDIPSSTQYRGGAYRMRNRDIKEVIWPENNAEKSAQTAWEQRMTEVKNSKPPEGKNEVLIEAKDLPDIGKWCKTIFYYGDPYDTERTGIPLKGYLDVLVNGGIAGAWITSFGKVTGKDFMYEKSTDLAKAYRPPAHRSGKAAVLNEVDAFYLQYGAIDLPFEYKESVDIGFKGHALDDELELSITTRVIHKMKKAGLLERAAASIAAKFIPGVKLEKLRSGKRTVAGLEGEELIERGTEDGDTSLLFAWMFLGEVDSSHRPHVIINMESRDGSLKEKMALWDGMLDSMRPAGR